ncbi:MAG: LamG-like jellyroll fold domain-containing protein [Kiritimatiellia bacterium]
MKTGIGLFRHAAGILLAGCFGLAAAVRAEMIDTSLFPRAATIRFAGCSVSTPLTNFPVLVKLAADCPGGFKYEDCAADSFRFTDWQGNVLPHEVETWDPAGTSCVWVSVPSLEPGEVIAFRYGADAAVLPANDPTEVWTRAGYVGVWHMAEASGTVADASGNGLDATHAGTVPDQPAAAGAIGTARCTATSSARGYLSIPSYDALALGGTFTISGWIKASAPNGYARLFSRKALYTDDEGWEIEMSNGSKTAFTARAAKNDARVSGSLPDLTTDWRLVAFAYAGTALTVFGDGVQVASGSVASTLPDNGKPLSFGCDSDGNEAWLPGSYDEVRLRRGVSTAEWIATEYANVRTDGFAVFSEVGAAAYNVVYAAAGTGGTVRIADGADAAEVQSSVALGETQAVVLTATAQEGYRFYRWSGSLSKIVSGTRFSPTITVETPQGASLAAEFIAAENVVEIVNAFDHPEGGIMSALVTKVGGSVFSNTTARIIAFQAPDQAPAGLREFIYANPAAGATTDFIDDWGFFRSGFVVGTSASTQEAVRYAHEAWTDAGSGICTYAGSWYVPAAGTYGFRMNMAGTGQLVIDNRIILQQKSAATVVATNGVSLAAGWHNLFIVFKAANGQIGPVDATAGGLLYSAADADLTADSAAGSPFATEEGGHRLSTAYSGVFVPSLWAEGGDVVLDCSNALGDLRIAGQWGAVKHRFYIANLPAGRTIEVGRPLNGTADGFQSLDGFAWVDWSRTELPEGVGIRFEGAVACNQPLPQGHAWTFGGYVTLATTVSDFFGVVAAGASEFSYPQGLVHLHLGQPGVLGDTATIKVASDQYLGYGGEPFGLKSSTGLPLTVNNSTRHLFRNPVTLAKSAVLNTTLQWDGVAVCAGTVTGEGSLRITGWGRRMYVDNAVDVGEVRLGQRGNRVLLRPPAAAAASRIGSVTLSGESSAYPTGGWEYCGATLFYCPDGSGASPLSIGKVSGGGAYYYPDQTKLARNGATLSTCSNNTVNVSSLVGSGIHLKALIPASANAEGTDVGGGNFVIGSIDAATTVFVATNVNLVVTNVAKAAKFRYDANAAGAVNDAVFDIEGSCESAATVAATDLAVLPARLKNFTGTVSLTETAEKEYPVTLDFSKSAFALGGCEGSGTLVAAPAAGTITVTFVGDTPVPGDWGLARFTAGGELLSGWTVSVPESLRGYVIEPVKDATGLWLKIRKGGMCVLIR